MVSTRSTSKKPITQTQSEQTSTTRKTRKKGAASEVSSVTQSYEEYTGNHTIPAEVLALREQAKRPKPLPSRVAKWIHLQCFRYTYLFGPYNLDFWEGLLMALIQLFIAGLIAYGIFKNGAKVVHYVADKYSKASS